MPFEKPPARGRRTLQVSDGHSATHAECTACHATVRNTITGGTRGMHTTGNAWISSHKNVAESGGAFACAYCHGADYRGTALSQVMECYRGVKPNLIFAKYDSSQSNELSTLSVRLDQSRPEVLDNLLNDLKESHHENC